MDCSAFPLSPLRRRGEVIQQRPRADYRLLRGFQPAVDVRLVWIHACLQHDGEPGRGGIIVERTRTRASVSSVMVSKVTTKTLPS